MCHVTLRRSRVTSQVYRSIIVAAEESIWCGGAGGCQWPVSGPCPGHTSHSCHTAPAFPAIFLDVNNNKIDVKFIDNNLEQNNISDKDGG